MARETSGVRSVIARAVWRSLHRVLLAAPRNIPSSLATWSICFHHVSCVFPQLALCDSTWRWPQARSRFKWVCCCSPYSSPSCITSQVLFPLITDLSPAGQSTGSSGPAAAPPERLIDMEEQRMALATTLTRTFKHHIKELASLPDFHSLWLKLVGAVLMLLWLCLHYSSLAILMLCWDAHPRCCCNRPLA